MSRASSNIDALFAEVRQDNSKRAKADKWQLKAIAIRGLLMPCQRRLEEDASRRISVRAARRTGKSTGALLVVTLRCLENPGSFWYIIGLTRMSVKRNYWADFQLLKERYELGITFNHQELTATFPNGSKIYFAGADNASEIEKLRGGKYDGVLIDECKSYSEAVFSELIQDVIEPALMDRRGQLIVIGTPGDWLDGPFYLATMEDPILIRQGTGDHEVIRVANAPYGSYPEHEALWSLHPWTLQDNVTEFIGKTGQRYKLWDEALKLKKRNGWGDDHPTWRREYLGHWVANNLKRVYRFKGHIHTYTRLHDTKWGLPEVLDGRKVVWRTCIGWDFGSKDGTAAVVWAFSDTHPGLWELYSHREKSTDARPLNISYIAKWYQDLDAEFGPFEGWPADMAGLATMVIDTLASEHGVFLEPAEKTEKNDHIELFNNDLDAGYIHCLRESELSLELPGNKWLEKTIGTDNRKEDPSTPNDLCDAALYAFRWCRHRQAKAVIPTVPYGSVEWINQQAQRDVDLLIAKAKSAHDPTQLDQEWWNVAN